LVAGDWTAWWVYLVGPAAGAAVAVGIAWVLRGPGGGKHGRAAAQGTLGLRWRPGPVVPPTGPPTVTAEDDGGAR
jgi:aquaporin Z